MTQPAYAGIGSRRTPATCLGFMERMAARLAGQGYTLRSGPADGAHSAFEPGPAAGRPGHLGKALRFRRIPGRLERHQRLLDLRNVGQLLLCDDRLPRFIPRGAGRGDAGRHQSGRGNQEQ